MLSVPHLTQQEDKLTDQKGCGKNQLTQPQHFSDGTKKIMKNLIQSSQC